jgi:molybdenum cofactor synthesis domain-containing protein
VGTELTDGELVNSNAAWLSDQLTSLGYKTRHHLTVPDERALIQEALHFLSASTQRIFVTGGLGPTTDDFTREEIASFCAKKLCWDEDSWTRVVDRLNSVGAPIVDSNKRQCYFPEGARVLSNPMGTASGFRVDHDNCELIVLPGPPNEINAIWHAHLVEELRAEAKASSKKNLHKFICLGMSESKLGEIIEAALEGSNFEIGYRARVPYVDLKVWTDEHNEHDFLRIWKQKILMTLGGAVKGEGTFDAADTFVGNFAGLHLTIFDQATGGRIARRCLDRDNPPAGLVVVSGGENDVGLNRRDANYAQINVDVEKGAWTIQGEINGRSLSVAEVSRLKGQRNIKRLQAYICELVFIELGKIMFEKNDKAT